LEVESGRWTKSENLVILSVIHHRQDPIESTASFLTRTQFHGVVTFLDMRRLLLSAFHDYRSELEVETCYRLFYVLLCDFDTFCLKHL
jgi:hypothetical protein